MQNPIPKSNLFTTPSLEEIQQFINSLPSKEQANANLVFMFTINSCAALVDQQQELDNYVDNMMV
jgi:hypothetical protein